MSMLIDNLKEDCRLLVNSFVAKNTTSFPEFITVWKEHQFDLIYAGQGEFDVDYFIFHVMHVAKSFCEPQKAELENVAGLYLLYLLYYTEPLKVKIPIRMVPDEFENLKDLAQNYKSINKEVSYAFYKLVLDEAFDFVVTSLPYDETLLHYKEEIKTRGVTSAEQQTNKAAFEKVMELTEFDRNKWTNMRQDYNKMKKKINGCSSLNLGLTNDFEDP